MRSVPARMAPVAAASRAGPSSARFSSSTFTPGSPRNPSERPSVWPATSSSTVASESPRARATRGAWMRGIGDGDVRVEPRSRRRSPRRPGRRAFAARPFSRRYAAARLRTSSSSVGFDGPRFEADARHRVVAVTGRRRPRLEASADRLNVCPISDEPTTLPLRLTSEPLALTGERDLRDAGHASGYTRPTSTVSTTIMTRAGSELATHQLDSQRRDDEVDELDADERAMMPPTP